MSALARRVEFPLPGGITIVGDAYGDAAAPPVVFLHGGGQTRHAWGGTAIAVGAAGWHALSLDLRGHGESSWDPAGDYGEAAFIADLRAVIGTLASMPIVVGASLGGIT